MQNSLVKNACPPLTIDMKAKNLNSEAPENLMSNPNVMCPPNAAAPAANIEAPASVPTSKVVLSNPMSKAFVAAAISAPKVHVTFKSEPAPAAEHKGRKLVKVTSGIYLSGVNYAEIPAVKNAIEKGERGPVEPLKGGEWVIFPLVMVNKEGKEKVRLTFGPDKSSVHYTVDDVPVSKEHFESFLVKSKRSGYKSPSPVFDIFAENIISVVGVN